VEAKLSKKVSRDWLLSTTRLLRICQSSFESGCSWLDKTRLLSVQLSVEFALCFFVEV
jgi:hypothetical protein